MKIQNKIESHFMPDNFVKVKIFKEPGTEDIPLPEYQTEGSAGMDLHAVVKEEIVLMPGERKLIPTGIKIALPQGYEAQIRPRSGLAIKYGIGMLNSPGTIDSDYRGDRIAQMIIAPVSRVQWEPVSILPDSTRGPGGFGHTGTSHKNNIE